MLPSSIPEIADYCERRFWQSVMRMIMLAGRPIADRGFLSVLWAQALTALHHNQLRSALLTMVAFGTIETGSWPAELVIGATTILAVLPYVLLSLTAGRWTDSWSRAGVFRICKIAELPIAAFAAAGLLTGNLPIMLLSVLFCGIEAAVLGPAKFAILPELVDARHLMVGNSWVTATSTVAILAGLVIGNVLASAPYGMPVLAALGFAWATIGALLSLSIPNRGAIPPDRVTHARNDTARILAQAIGQPRIVFAILGCSWFWFQGAFNTAAIPILIAAQGMEEDKVSVLFIVSSLGVAAGALAARVLQGKISHSAVSVAVSLMTLLPSADIGLFYSEPSFPRLLLAIASMSIASGLFIVPTGLAMQVLPPAADRGRYIGTNHLFNGLAMLLAGTSLAALGILSIGPAAAISGIGIVGAGVTVATLVALLPALASSRTGEQFG